MGGWVLGAGGSKIKTKLSPQLGLAKLELGLSLAKILGKNHCFVKRVEGEEDGI